MCEPELPNDDISLSIPEADDRGSRYVIDYTVGPPGVGPVTSVARREPQENASENSLVEQQSGLADPPPCRRPTD